MTSLLLHYYFTKDAIDSLDKKYKDQMNVSDFRTFLFGNFYDLGTYFKYSNLLRKDEFNLSHKLHSKKQLEFIEESIKYAKSYGLSRDHVFLIYTFAANYIFDQILTPYLNELESKLFIDDLGKIIDYLITLKRDSLDLRKTALIKRFKGAFIFTFEDIDFIDHLIENTYFFSKAESYYRISMEYFKKKLRKKLYSKVKVFEDIDYLNDDKKYLNESFDEAYERALDDLKVLYKAINEYLFLDDDKSFMNLLSVKKGKVWF